MTSLPNEELSESKEVQAGQVDVAVSDETLDEYVAGSRSPSIETITDMADDSDIEILSTNADTISFRTALSHKHYKRRWYILALFATMCLHQCLIWNTFGPIDKAVKYAYGWKDSTVAMMANWGTILFVIGVIPLSWFLEAKGLRKTVLLVSGFMAVGTTLRVVSTNDTVFTVMSHACAILNGLSGVTIMAAPSALSAAWFPPSERTTATCLNLVFNSLGNAVSFTLGPYLVPDTNISTVANLNGEKDLESSMSRDEVKMYIQWYMVGMAAVSVVLFVAFVIYFPDKPPSPPSNTSTMPRIDFKQGMKDLVSSKNIWFCTLGYGLPNGIVAAWQAVMVINFSPLGVSEREIGFIGFLSVVVCSVIAPFVAFSMDRFKKHFKSSLIGLTIASTICFSWLFLLCVKIIPFSIPQLYISTILGCGFVSMTGFIFYEYTVELAFPVSEGLVCAFITGFNNLLGVLFYSLFFIPNMTFTWINYVIVGACALAVPATILTKADYRRLDLDEPEVSSRTSIFNITGGPYTILEDDSGGTSQDEFNETSHPSTVSK